MLSGRHKLPACVIRSVVDSMNQTSGLVPGPANLLLTSNVRPVRFAPPAAVPGPSTHVRSIASQVLLDWLRFAESLAPRFCPGFRRGLYRPPDRPVRPGSPHGALGRRLCPSIGCSDRSRLARASRSAFPPFPPSCRKAPDSPAPCEMDHVSGPGLPDQSMAISLAIVAARSKWDALSNRFRWSKLAVLSHVGLAAPVRARNVLLLTATPRCPRATQLRGGPKSRAPRQAGPQVRPLSSGWFVPPA